MNKSFNLIIFGLILCIVLVTGCSKISFLNPTNPIKTLKFENIKSAEIELATVGAIPAKTYTFDFNNYKQIKIIEDIIKYLNSSKV